MQLPKIISLVLTIRRLRKRNDAWAKVYESYLLCLRLIILVTIIRFVTEWFLLITAILGLYYALNHLCMFTATKSSSVCRILHSCMTFIEQKVFLP